MVYCGPEYLRLIIVLRVEILDLGFREIQLRLGQLDDGGQTEIVAPLREIQRQRRLAEKLGGNVDSLIRVVRAGPGYTDVPREPLLFVAQLLVGLQRALSAASRRAENKCPLNSGDADIGGKTFIFGRDRRRSPGC